MTGTSAVLWKPRDVVSVPASAITPAEIATVAKQLSKRELEQIIKTYDAGLYEMGATFVWTRTMAGLRRQLSSLGIEFVAEMLDRPDIRPGADIHEVLTDFEAVRLAEELGMFGGSHALRLRHSLEIVAHFADPPDDVDEEGMTHEEAVGTLRTCVQTVLGHESLNVAVEFADFRKRLETEVLEFQSAEIENLANSAYFFQRSVCRILMAGVKTAQGAQLENLLANSNAIVPALWPGLMDPDRYLVGRAYSEVHADGQSKAATGLRSALLKVRGFDYVPEDLRSRSFLEAAARVLEAHFGWDNFASEPSPVRALESLGSSIPSPAFARCMTAVLAVKLGNRYGQSWDAQTPADKILDGVTQDRWKYFFDRCLPTDDVVLEKLTDIDIARRWTDFLGSLDQVRDLTPDDRRSRELLEATKAGNATQVSARAKGLLRSIRQD